MRKRLVLSGMTFFAGIFFLVFGGGIMFYGIANTGDADRTMVVLTLIGNKFFLKAPHIMVPGTVLAFFGFIFFNREKSICNKKTTKKKK